jgi:hypothetical protein
MVVFVAQLLNNVVLQISSYDRFLLQPGKLFRDAAMGWKTDEPRSLNSNLRRLKWNKQNMSR